MLLGAMPLIASDVSASLTDSFETNTGDFTHSSGWATYGISTDWAADGTHSLEMYEQAGAAAYAYASISDAIPFKFTARYYYSYSNSYETYFMIYEVVGTSGDFGVAAQLLGGVATFYWWNGATYSALASVGSWPMTTARTLTVWQYANNATVSVSGAQSVSWATSIASPQSLYVGKTNSGNAKIYVDALTTTSLPPINPWAPTYTSSANTYATKNIAYSYHVTLNESSTFSLINGGGFLTVSNSKNGTAGTSFYLNGTPSSSGSKSITTKAVSVAGTLTAYQNYTVNVNNTWSPTWTSSLPATGQVGVFWSYHLTCNESVAFTINTKPAWATWASGNSTLYGTPSSSGAASFKLDATSTAGLLNAWQNGSSVISPDWAPTFTSSPGTIGQVGVFYSYHPTLNETGTITELQKPSWAIWASGNSTLYGTPTSSGIVQFELNSLSTAGKLSKTQWWNVSVSPDWAPTYLSTPIYTGQIGVLYSIPWLSMRLEL